MKNSSKMLIGLATLFTAGLVVGILYAPDKGIRTRKKMSKKSKRLLQSAENAWEDGKETIQEWRDKVIDKMEALKNEVKKVV